MHVSLKPLSAVKFKNVLLKIGAIAAAAAAAVAAVLASLEGSVF